MTIEAPFFKAGDVSDWVTLCRFMAILGCLAGLVGLTFMLSLFWGCVVNKHRQMRKRVAMATLVAITTQSKDQLTRYCVMD